MKITKRKKNEEKTNSLEKKKNQNTNVERKVKKKRKSRAGSLKWKENILNKGIKPTYRMVFM